MTKVKISNWDSVEHLFIESDEMSTVGEAIVRTYSTMNVRTRSIQSGIYFWPICRVFEYYDLGKYEGSSALWDVLPAAWEPG